MFWWISTFLNFSWFFTSRPRFRILLIHSAFSHDIDPLSKGEVGFHAGHSAAIMLNANAKARVFVLRAHDDRLRVSIVQPWIVWNDSQDFNLFLDFLIFSFQHAEGDFFRHVAISVFSEQRGDAQEFVWRPFRGVLGTVPVRKVFPNLILRRRTIYDI